MEFDFSKQVKSSEKLVGLLTEEKERKETHNRPDADFAYIKAGGSKDETDRTVPRSLRQFPLWTNLHIQRSVEDLGKSSLPSEAKAESFIKIKARAHQANIEVSEEAALGAERFDGKKRSELPDSAFLDPKRRSFPVVSCKNVRAAVSTWGMYKGSMSFEEFKGKLTARAKKLGCASSLPKTWKGESSAKDWEKIDTDELKRDDKKEKKEHHKDAVEDDEDKIKKLKKGKPSEKKSVEIHDLKKDIKEDKEDAKSEMKKSTAPMNCPTCY